MREKRNRIAAVADGLAIPWFMTRFLPQTPSLIVLNYHRIGDLEATPFDGQVFSATAEEFRRQVDYLKRRYEVIDLERAVALAQGKSTNHASILITFDDGYLDNYTLAFPILREAGVPGVFFLPTSFIGTNRIPWWDTIAYVVRQSRKLKVAIDYPRPMSFDLETSGRTTVVEQLLELYKSPQTTDGERFIAQLESAFGQNRPDADNRCFLNWDEAREMVAGKMDLASHTHTHEILAKKPIHEQTQDLLEAKQILQRELGVTGDVLAYPVGLPDAFNAETVQALKNAGYRAAFSFYGGFNLAERMSVYDIRRQSVTPDIILSRFRLQTSLAAATGRIWF